MTDRALSGARAWLVQRLSALYMLLFMLLTVTWWLGRDSAPLGFSEWQQLLASPIVMGLVVLFFLALLLHAWVGVRDILLDYAGQRPVLRLFLLLALGLWLLGLAIWCLRIFIKVMAI